MNLTKLNKSQKIELTLHKLGRLWKKHPDLRLGQLIDNALTDYPVNLRIIEDYNLLAEISDFVKNHEYTQGTRRTVRTTTTSRKKRNG